MISPPATGAADPAGRPKAAPPAATGDREPTRAPLNPRPTFFFGVGAAVLAAGAVSVGRSHVNAQAGTILYVLAGFLVIAAVAGPFISASLDAVRNRHQLLNDAEKAAIKAATDKIGDDKPLGKLINFNFQLMDRFIDVALTQAKAAYFFCAAASSAGLLILLTGTAALLSADDVTGQVTVGVLTAAGAALAGYISHTFLSTLRMTSRQMSYYYGQPVVHCYLLHAEWLAERASLREPGPFDGKLIDAMIQAGRDAQCHLVDLVEDRPSPLEGPEVPAPGASDNGVSSAR